MGSGRSDRAHIDGILRGECLKHKTQWNLASLCLWLSFTESGLSMGEKIGKNAKKNIEKASPSRQISRKMHIFASGFPMVFVRSRLPSLGLKYCVEFDVLAARVGWDFIPNCGDELASLCLWLSFTESGHRTGEEMPKNQRKLIKINVKSIKKQLKSIELTLNQSKTN